MALERKITARNPIERQTEYDLLRILLTMLVLIGHSTYYDIFTPFGGIHYGVMLNSAGIAEPCFYTVVAEITRFVYTFHMPVFIALSGSLYAISKKSGTKEFIKKKFCRLIIPFICVWLFWNIPIKWLTGYYEGISLRNMFLQMIFPDCVYLWYLECLFLIFVIMRLLEPFSEKIQCFAICSLWAIGLIFYELHILGDPLYYILWFYIGSKIETIIHGMQKYRFWNGRTIALLLIIYVLIYILDRTQPFYLTNELCKHILFPLLMFIILNYSVRRIKVRDKLSEKVSRYTMGVYLYAEPLNYLILFLFYHACGLEFFGSNKGSAAIYLCRLLITPAVAVIITWFLKKLNLRYLY